MSAASLAAAADTAGQKADQRALPRPRRLPVAEAWEGARGKKPLDSPRWAPSGCAGGLGLLSPGPGSVNSVPGGQQRPALRAERRNWEAGPGRSPRRRLEPRRLRHPDPRGPEPSARVGSRWHLKGGQSWGQDPQERGCSAPGGRGEGTCFTQSILRCQTSPERASRFRALASLRSELVRAPARAPGPPLPPLPPPL